MPCTTILVGKDATYEGRTAAPDEQEQDAEE